MSDSVDVIRSAIEARRTVHKYRRNCIDSALLNQALQLALCAPNHRHTFPWLFRIVGTETREALLDLDRTIKPNSAAFADELTKLEQKRREKFMNPAGLVVFAQRIVEDHFQDREDYATIACSIQNFCLFLVAKGYGSKWSTGAITRHEETHRILQIDPIQHKICGFVWVGLPDGALGPQRRPQLKDILKCLP